MRNNWRDLTSATTPENLNSRGLIEEEIQKRRNRIDLIEENYLKRQPGGGVIIGGINWVDLIESTTSERLNWRDSIQWT